MNIKYTCWSIVKCINTIFHNIRSLMSIFLYSEIAIICGVEYYRFDGQFMIPIIIKFLKGEPKVLNGNL